MSLLSGAMGTALGVLGNAAGQILHYRTGPTGTWTSLPNGFLEQLDPQVVEYDDKQNAVVAPARATLRVAAGGPRLLPGTGDKAWQVRHTLGASITIWGVAGASHNDGVSMYELQRARAQQLGDARDAVPR